MTTSMTRTKAIEVWVGLVLLSLAAMVTLGVEMTVGTGAMLLALALVPPGIILTLWPRSQEPATAASVLYGSDSPR